MQHDDRIYLEHMLDVAARAHTKVAGRSLEEWESDEDLRLAVTHLVQTLGEAARRVSAGPIETRSYLPRASFSKRG